MKIPIVVLAAALGATAAARVAVTNAPALTSIQSGRSTMADRVMELTRDSPWQAVASVPVAFPTHHPQGMVRIGDTLLRLVRRGHGTDAPVAGAGQTATTGMRERASATCSSSTRSGHLIADLTLGEGTIYHPGGIDYDGTYIWVPVAEYRPNSRSIVYRVKPETMQADRGIQVQGPHRRHRPRYRQPHAPRRELGFTPVLPMEARSGTGRSRTPAPRRRGCARSTRRTISITRIASTRRRARMLCTGVTELRQKPDAPPFRLGGIELVSLADGRPLHQVPLLLWTDGGMDMTHNPVWLEPSGDGSARLLHARRQHVDALRLRGHTSIVPGCRGFRLQACQACLRRKVSA